MIKYSFMLTEMYTINKREREDTGKQKENMSIIPRRLGKYELQESLGRGGTAEVTILLAANSRWASHKSPRMFSAWLRLR